MMRSTAVFSLVAGTTAQLSCHSLSPTVQDDWCNSNCNHSPPNCPASLCQCDAPAPTPPSPSPSPSPVPSPGPSPAPAVDFPVFQLDLFVNDPGDGWQPTGWPAYLQHNAAEYTNVAGISFIQPADLCNAAYDLPSEVGGVVNSLRQQGVQVQLLVGGQISSGWSELQANPGKAAAKAIEIMKKYDCGIQVDNEAGGDSAGTIAFIKAVHDGKPAGTHLSMDVAGTPSGDQREVIQGAIDYLQFVNLMVSAPAYDQENSINFGHQYGIPYEKMTIAYYAGTWVDNCNSLGPADDNGRLGAGVRLFNKYGLKGLTIWAVGGASYANCPTDDSGAQGFAAAVSALGAHNGDDPSGSSVVV